MNINYILLVHKNPEQLQQLVTRLQGQNIYFYIHVDQNVDIQPFVKALNEVESAFFLENREKGIWGDIGIVKASINALKEIAKRNEPGYCVLLSGQDYPIKSNQQIYKFLHSNYGKTFIDAITFEESAWPNNGADRIKHYKFNLSPERGHFLTVPSILSREFFKDWRRNFGSIIHLLKRNKLPLLIFKKRSFPKFMKPYAGSQWWAIPTETTAKILLFLVRHKEYIEYNKYSLLPDEFFFQSIIKYLKSTDDNIKLSPSITYANWSRVGVPLPVTFTSTDLEELLNQPEGKLFARKFEMDANDKIIDLLQTSGHLL